MIWQSSWTPRCATSIPWQLTHIQTTQLLRRSRATMEGGWPGSGNDPLGWWQLRSYGEDEQFMECSGGGGVHDPIPIPTLQIYIYIFRMPLFALCFQDWVWGIFGICFVVPGLRMRVFLWYWVWRFSFYFSALPFRELMRDGDPSPFLSD